MKNGPPTDIGPSELFLKLLERPYPSDVIDFPAKGFDGAPLAQVRVRVLPDDVGTEARFAAIARLKKRGMSDQEFASPYGEKLLGDAVAKEMLAIAIVRDKPIDGDEEKPVYPRIFRDGADVAKLTSDEITALFGAYLLVQKRYGPSARELDDAGVNAWIERLAVGASELPLHRLDLYQLAELCTSLAQRAFTLSKLLASQRESSQINWESIPESWDFITTSPSEPAAVDTRSDDGVITAAQAMAAAKQFIGR